MRHQPSYAILLIGLLLTSVVAGQPCSAQDVSAGGQGYAPMGPSAPMSSGNLNRPVVPGPAMQPGATSRPATWPGVAEPQASPWVPPDQRSASPQTPPAGAAPPGEMKQCDGTRIIARVGSEAVFESEVAGAVNEVLEKNKDRIPPSQLDAQRELLVQQRLKGLIETKLIYQDAKRTIPAEGFAQFEKKVGQHFEDVELDRLMKNAGIAARQEFDQKLRSLGTSLEHEKRAFVERTLAQEWVRQQVKRDEETTYDQLVGYYRTHLQEYTTPARVQWEELMARYSKYPTKVAAFDAIAQMGNRVVRAGEPFAAVAKSGSDGVTATEGGQHDWTSKGALVNKEFDAALFGQPIGQMGPIIAGDKGYHIIRVTKREEEVVQSFQEAQAGIKKKIVDQRSQKQFREYLAKLEARTPVWTLYDSKSDRLQLATPPQRRPIQR